MGGLIEVVSVCFVRAGAVLTVRKAGTSKFMLPGGKPEPGESMPEAAAREVREEVGFDPVSLHLLGVHTVAAANEPGMMIRSHTFRGVLPDLAEPAAAGEIAELRWQPLTASYSEDLAPLLTEIVLPLLGSEVLGSRRLET